MRKRRENREKLIIKIVINNGNINFLPRDASAERGNATVSRPSVRLSVCL